MKGISRMRMKGQAMVLFLGFAAAMIGVMLVAFNSGQVTNAKMRAMNAADAAAYSGAVWQARSLNFQAYMNRAMIVNEVTIAQSVSLRSWIDYLARFVSNINMVTRWIPYAGTVTTAISRGLDRVDEVMQDAMPFFEQVARGAAHVEHIAQVGFNADGPIGAVDIALDVAKKNGAEVSPGGYALFATNAADWVRFTETYSKSARPAGTSGDGRRRMRDVTLDSRDGFTQNRKWDWDFIIVEVHKQGGTDLVNYDSWKGLDSAGLCHWKPFRGCRGYIPMGWGGAQAYNPNKVTRIGTHGDGSDWNRIDGRAAQREANSGDQATRLNFEFSDYRDLQTLDTRRAQRLKIPFAVEVVIKDAKVPTANSAFKAKVALTDGTKLEHDPQYASGTSGVYGLAEACVSFERPFRGERADRGGERPSLFNPYWRASMATPSRRTRAEVGTTKLLPPVEAFFGGSGSCA